MYLGSEILIETATSFFEEAAVTSNAEAANPLFSFGSTLVTNEGSY